MNALRVQLFSGTFIFLALGFVTSAVANRTAFAAWGLVAATGYGAALLYAFRRGAPAHSRWAVVATVAAVAVAMFGHLMARYGEPLDLGVRALFPSLHHPWLTRPATAYGAASLLGGVALSLWIVGKGKVG